jgi:hypothetical protein
MKKRLLLCLVSAVIALNGWATAYEWKVTNTDSDWNTATNWNPEGVPGAGDDVTISSANNQCPYTVICSGNITINNLIIGGNGRLRHNGSGNTFTITGNLTLSGNNNSTCFSTSDVNKGGIASQGTVQVNGTFTFNSGTIGFDNLTGTVNANGPVSFAGNDNKFISSGKLRIAGTADWIGDGNIFISETGHEINGRLEVLTGATFNVNTGTGILVLSNGGYSGPTGVTNDGTFWVPSGKTLTLQLNEEFVNNGSMAGSGIIKFTGGNFMNYGTFSPGNTGATAILEVNRQISGFTLPIKNLDIQIGGTTAGTEYDRLFPTFNAALSGGSLNLTLVNGYTPQVGHSFTVLDATSMTGTFASPSNPFTLGGAEWSITYNNTEGTVVLNVLSLLPVELTDFRARLLPDATVRLDWQTAAEVNTRQFTLQRSADGNHWEELGSLPARNAGNYQWLDNQPFEDENYYRLRIEDLDGSFQFSEVVFVKNERKTGALAAYPNPSADGLFHLQLPSENCRVRVYNIQGQLLLEEEMSRQVYELSLGNFLPGVYLLAVVSPGGKVDRLWLRNQ